MGLFGLFHKCPFTYVCSYHDYFTIQLFFSDHFDLAVLYSSEVSSSPILDYLFLGFQTGGYAFSASSC